MWFVLLRQPFPADPNTLFNPYGSDFAFLNVKKLTHLFDMKAKLHRILIIPCSKEKCDSNEYRCFDNGVVRRYLFLIIFFLCNSR